MSTLTRSEVRMLSRTLKAAGLKLPKVGWKVRLPDSNVSVCRDGGGYYTDGPYPGITTKLARGNVYI